MFICGIRTSAVVHQSVINPTCVCHMLFRCFITNTIHVAICCCHEHRLWEIATLLWWPPSVLTTSGSCQNTDANVQHAARLWKTRELAKTIADACFNVEVRAKRACRDDCVVYFNAEIDIPTWMYNTPRGLQKERFPDRRNRNLKAFGELIRTAAS